MQLYESRWFRSYSELSRNSWEPLEVSKHTFEATGENLEDVLSVLITGERLQCLLQYTQEDVNYSNSLLESIFSPLY